MIARNPALAAALLISGCAAQVGPSSAEALSPNQRPLVASVCEINREAASAQRRSRLVSITAGAWYDFEYGYKLIDDGCGDPMTGLLPVSFPPGTSHAIPPDGYPELAKLHSDEFMRSALGKRIYCKCVGEVTFSDGHPTFLLHRAEKVWAE